MLWLQFISLLVILQNTCVKASGNEKYCYFKCGSHHIACKHNEKPSPHCPDNVQEYHMDGSIRSFILSLHNEKRNEVAGGDIKHLPTASRMAHMIWDEELAYMAKLKALNCSKKVEHCHSTEKFEDPGQNIGWLNYDEESEKFVLKSLLQNRISSWFEGSVHCKTKHIQKYHNANTVPHISDFTLAITDRNTHVGCGAIHYQIKPKTYFHLVCNYAHGNVIDHPVYKIGPPASECKTGMDKKYKHLCMITEKYE